MATKNAPNIRILSKSAPDVGSASAATPAGPSTQAMALPTCPLARLKPFLLYEAMSAASLEVLVPNCMAKRYNVALSEAFKGSFLGDPFAVSLVSLDDALASMDLGNLRNLGQRLAEAAFAQALPVVPAQTRFHLVVQCVSDQLIAKA